MSRYKETGIVIDDCEVGRVWTCADAEYGTCINIDIFSGASDVYLTKDELKAMIAAIDARESEGEVEDLSRD